MDGSREHRVRDAHLKEQFEAKYLEAPRKRRCRLTVVVRDYYDFEIETGDLTTETARGKLLRAAVEKYRSRIDDGTERLRFDTVDFDKDEFELSVGSDDNDPCEAEVLHLRTDGLTNANFEDGFEPHPWQREYRIPGEATKATDGSGIDGGRLFDEASYLVQNLPVIYGPGEAPDEPGVELVQDERIGVAARFVYDEAGLGLEEILGMLEMFPYRAQWVNGNLDEMRHEHWEQQLRLEDARRAERRRKMHEKLDDLD